MIPQILETEEYLKGLTWQEFVGSKVNLPQHLKDLPVQLAQAAQTPADLTSVSPAPATLL